jgi:dUTP pyrophosphatase
MPDILLTGAGLFTIAMDLVLVAAVITTLEKTLRILVRRILRQKPERKAVSGNDLVVDIIVTDPALHIFGGLPRMASPGAAAVDLVALGYFTATSSGKPDLAVRKEMPETLTLNPGGMAFVCVGFRMHIRGQGYAAHIIPRSGSAATGLRLANTAGLIDPDYQGPIIVAIENSRAWRDLSIRRGERVAQMYFTRVHQPLWREVTDFSEATQRGHGAFGSTGTR